MSEWVTGDALVVALKLGLPFEVGDEVQLRPISDDRYGHEHYNELRAKGTCFLKRMQPAVGSQSISVVHPDVEDFHANGYWINIGDLAGWRRP